MHYECEVTHVDLRDLREKHLSIAHIPEINALFIISDLRYFH